MSATGDAQDAEKPTPGNEPGRALAAGEGTQDVHTDEFGPALREAREKAGLSVVEVANALKVTERTVNALEAERYEDLPPRPYVRGHVQRYARLVGLDAGTAVRSGIIEAESALPVVVPRSRWALFNDFARESWGLVYGSIVLVFVILIGGALWWAWPGGNTEQAASVAAPATVGDPAPAVAAGPPATELVPGLVTAVEAGVDDADTGETPMDEGLAGPDRITFVFEGDCWVEVWGPDGDLLHGDLGRDGGTTTVRGRVPFSVLLGNPAVVDVAFNGERVSLDSVRPGQVASFEVGG